MSIAPSTIQTGNDSLAEMLQLLASRSKVMLRVQFSLAPHAAASLHLPTEPLTTSGEDPKALWMAPDQWLLTSDLVSADDLIRQCRRSLGGQTHSATDASAALAAFRLEHRRAGILLAMGCGLNFDTLVQGQCARTRLACISAIIVPLSGTAYDVYVDRSYARHLELWLTLARNDPLVGTVAS